MTNLSKEFYINNRKNLIKNSGAKLIAIAANGLMQRTSSTTLEFTQDSNFFYLTGVTDPNMILVISEDDEFLIAGQQTDVGKVFDGDVDQQKIVTTCGIKKVLSYEDGWKELEALAKKHKTVHTVKPPDAFIPIYSMYTNPARADLVKKLKKAGAKAKDVYPVIADMRVIKQPQEIAAIKQAIKITGHTFDTILKNIANYDFEFEIDADVTAIFYKLNQERPGYESIIASGKNACTIHHIGNNTPVDKSKVLLMDIGAQSDHYSADITRVLLPSNDSRAEEVFKAVSELHAQALTMIKPGVKFIDYERAMVKFYADKLQELGLINNPLEKEIRKYMPHATSHFLGLDTHDAGDYQQEFKAGMVITVEPGFYIAEEEIGIRIEDDILITETDIEVLSKDIPHKMKLN